ncbi:MAG TPA: hypothetical protein VKA97_12600 [Pyrinomonadaceae bacterium]|nr:hypothetical protein [Pyrinomonadaceae bacterium]
MRVPLVSLGSRAATIAGFHTEGCDESLWSHIYNPGRLEVLNKCISVTGTVARVKKEADGDYSIQLMPDKGYEGLLNEHNFDRQEGALVVRAICQTKDKDKKEECKNFDKQIEIPARGAHVRVTGSYVLNRTTIYSWAEIYPATTITVIP